MTSSRGMHRIAIDANAPLRKVFDNRRELVAGKLVVTVFLKVQVSEMRRRIFQRNTLVHVNAFIQTVSATINRQNCHLIERCRSDRAVGMSEVMRDRNHRNVLIEYSWPSPPAVTLFDHAEVCVLHDEVQIADTNSFEIKTVFDGVCIVATGMLASRDSFFLDGNTDAAIFQETSRTIVRKVCSKEVNWFALSFH